MSVITSDESDHVATVSTTLLHVRRTDAERLVPALCGDDNGPGAVVAEGEELGSAWPYDGHCAVCVAIHARREAVNF